jgi:hypothetical protein
VVTAIDDPNADVQIAMLAPSAERVVDRLGDAPTAVTRPDEVSNESTDRRPS